MRWARSLILDEDRQLLGKLRTDVLAAAANFSERADQLFGCAFFRDIPGGAGAQDANRKLIFRMHAEDEHRQRRPFALHFLQHIQAVAPWHSDVQHQRVDTQSFKRRQNFVTIGSFTDDGELWIFRQDLLQSLTDDRVVIGDQDSNHFAPWFSLVAPLTIGTSTRTVVPSPSRPSIVNSPCNKRTRSCIPMMPSEYLP